METILFQSTRLTYRKINRDDFQLFYMLHADEDTMNYSRQDVSSSESELHAQFTEILQEKISHFYVASIIDENISIGIVGYNIELSHPNGGIVDIGYILKKDFWKQGFGTEMGNAIIHHIFNTTNVHKITGKCNIENIASQNILKKIGMKLEGVYREKRYKHDKWIDEAQYGLLKSEFLEK